MSTVTFSYLAPDDTALEIPARNLLAVLEPKKSSPLPSLLDALRDGIARPIGTEPLLGLARGHRNALIVSDDYTRLTPLKQIIPLILATLNEAGIPDDRITIVVAQGTHRRMTPAETEERFGRALIERVRIMPHEFNNPEALAYLGKTKNGTEIWLNKLVLAADFVVGVGNILPHAYAGFSGGAKIIQPGVSGTITTGQTHFLSVHTGLHLGNPENPTRHEMEAVADEAGLGFIVNTVMNLDKEVVAVVCGDHRKAFRAGAEIARRIFSAEAPGLADIAITDAYPHIYNLWQGGKGLYSGRLAVKAGGTIILAAPCVEGYGDEARFVELLHLNRQEIMRRVAEGTEQDLFIAAPAANVARVREECDIILVTHGLSRSEVEDVGFRYAPNLPEALAMGLARQGADAKVTAMRLRGRSDPGNQLKEM